MGFVQGGNFLPASHKTMRKIGRSLLLWIQPNNLSERKVSQIAEHERYEGNDRIEALSKMFPRTNYHIYTGFPGDTFLSY